MKNGFIFETFDTLIRTLNYLNLVELFKFVATRLTPPGRRDEDVRKNCNIAIDIFVVIKWFLVIFLLLNHIGSAFWTAVVFYLIWSNFHTYFNYHVWKDTGNNDDFDWSRRRFINLIFAISFTIISFGYLYSTTYKEDFIWSGFGDVVTESLLFSISQSLFLGSSTVSSKTVNGEFLVVLQSTITFIFVVIILAKSIPQPSARSKEKKHGI